LRGDIGYFHVPEEKAKVVVRQTKRGHKPRGKEGTENDGAFRLGTELRVNSRGGGRIGRVERRAILRGLPHNKTAEKGSPLEGSKSVTSLEERRE